MGKPLNKRNFGSNEGAVKVTFMVEGVDHEGFIVKQLSTKKYRVQSSIDDSIHDLFLDKEIKDGFVRISYKSSDVADGGISQLNSKLALLDGEKYGKWTTNPFASLDDYALLPVISNDQPLVEGKDAVSGSGSKMIPGVVDPVLIIGTGNPAINFVLEKSDTIELGISVRYSGDPDIPPASPTYDLPFVNDKGGKLRFAYSVTSAGGAMLKDFNIELRISRNTLNPSVDSDYMAFTLDAGGNWVSNMDSAVITDSAKTPYANQNIQSLSFDFIKNHFRQKFEGNPHGKFIIALIAVDPKGVETKVQVELTIQE